MNKLDIIRGLVRPLLTVGGFSAITVGFLTGRVSVELYLPIVSMMIGYWFAARTPPGGTP